VIIGNYIFVKATQFLSYFVYIIVGMQPQVSGEFGSLVGWAIFSIPKDCRTLLRSQLSGSEQKYSIERKENYVTKTT